MRRFLVFPANLSKIQPIFSLAASLLEIQAELLRFTAVQLLLQAASTGNTRGT
jgi:hypothetical protein